jgi:hypothetical protein
MTAYLAIPSLLTVAAILARWEQLDRRETRRWAARLARRREEA